MLNHMAQLGILYLVGDPIGQHIMRKYIVCRELAI